MFCAAIGHTKIRAHAISLMCFIESPGFNEFGREYYAFGCALSYTSIIFSIET